MSKPRHFDPALLFFLLVVYPLSIGPVFMLCLRHYSRESPMPRRVEGFILASILGRRPLRPNRKAFTWYLGLWIGDNPKHATSFENVPQHGISN